VRTSNCSRLFLSMCGERRTVKRLIFVGSGIGPAMSAPVRLTVSRIEPTALSKRRLSKAFKTILIFCPAITNLSFVPLLLFTLQRTGLLKIILKKREAVIYDKAAESTFKLRFCKCFLKTQAGQSLKHFFAHVRRHFVIVIKLH
jgi:hypothetical protein